MLVGMSAKALIEPVSLNKSIGRFRSFLKKASDLEVLLEDEPLWTNCDAVLGESTLASVSGRLAHCMVRIRQGLLATGLVRVVIRRIVAFRDERGHCIWKAFITLVDMLKLPTTYEQLSLTAQLLIMT